MKCDENKYCCPVHISKKGLGKRIKQDERLILEWLYWEIGKRMGMNTDQKYFVLTMLKFRILLLQSYLQTDKVFYSFMGRPRVSMLTNYAVCRNLQCFCLYKWTKLRYCKIRMAIITYSRGTKRIIITSSGNVWSLSASCSLKMNNFTLPPSPRKRTKPVL